MQKRQTLKIVQLGLGKVGRALVNLYLRQGADPRLQWVALGDRSSVWVAPDGWPTAALEEAISFKASGLPLTRWHPAAFAAEAIRGSEAYSPELLWRLDELSLHGSAIVDITSPRSGTLPLLKVLRRGGYDIVLASTAPLAAPLEDYRELIDQPRGTLNYNPVVGGQLPIVRLLRTLQASGDRITAIEAAPSGTLNLITDKLAEGWAFSAAVGEAARRGLSETDPREDLSGRDAARRMLTLARTLGLEIEMDHVERQSLIPDWLSSAPLPEFWGRLGELDHGLGTWAGEARARGNMLRYVARIAPPATLELRMTEVPTAGLAGGGCSASGLFLLYSERNGSQPIVLRGPASGPEVTAAAVYAELVGLLTGYEL